MWKRLALIGAQLQLCKASRGTGYFEAGVFYSALALNRTSGGRAQAEDLLRGLTECSNVAIQSRSWLALGSNLLNDGDSSKAIITYQKANQNSDSPLTIFFTAMMSIAVKSREGDHHNALDALNSIKTLADYIGRFYHPYWFHYLNGVAVELNNLNRHDEAKQVLAPVLKSPYADAYGEWEETDREIDDGQPAGNVFSIRSKSNEPSIGEKRSICLARIVSGPDELIERVYPLVA